MDQTKFHAPRLYNTSFVDNKKDEIEEVNEFTRKYRNISSKAAMMFIYFCSAGDYPTGALLSMEGVFKFSNCVRLRIFHVFIVVNCLVTSDISHYRNMNVATSLCRI